MKHTRHGFTMIELIFVIVIIGILAGVALPRFTGVSEDAHLSKVKAFVGTLNRTVAPAMWSSILSTAEEAGGSVKNEKTPAQFKKIFSETATDTSLEREYAQVEVIPSEFKDAKDSQEIDLTNCKTPTEITSDDDIKSATALDSVELGSKTYTLVCKDGSLSTAPHFYLLDKEKNIIAR